MSKPKRNLKRINIQLPVPLLSLLDEWAAANGLSRTTAIHLLVVDGLTDKGVLVDTKE